MIRSPPARAVDLGQRDDAVEMLGETQIMADEQQGGADRPAFGEQKVDEGLLTRRIERGGRLVGDDDFRTADQRARGGDALLLADRQFRRRFVPQRRCEVEMRKQPRSFVTRRVDAFPASRRKGAGQKHVVEGRQPGQQVELLKDETDMVGAKGIARPPRERRDVAAEQLDAALLRHGHAADQIEQRAFPGTRRSVQEHPFARCKQKLRNLDAWRRLARPAEHKIGEDERIHAGTQSRSVTRAGPAAWG
jgi:hypothetical protein